MRLTVSRAASASVPWTVPQRQRRRADRVVVMMTSFVARLAVAIQVEAVAVGPAVDVAALLLEEGGDAFDVALEVGEHGFEVFLARGGAGRELGQGRRQRRARLRWQRGGDAQARR